MTRFLGELVFNHDRMIVAIKVAEIAIAVVTRQIDLAHVVLVETYRGLDHVLHHCRLFYSCEAPGLGVVPPMLCVFCSSASYFTDTDMSSSRFGLLDT